MAQTNFPPGWDAARVERLIANYDALDEGKLVAEGEAVQEQPILQRMRSLSTWCYSLAGLTFLISCLPVFVLARAVLHMLTSHNADDGIALIVAMAFAGIPGILLLMAAGCIFWLGKNLSHQRHYTTCRYLAILLILFVPIGTILGICVLVSTGKPAVRCLFDKDKTSFVT